MSTAAEMQKMLGKEGRIRTSEGLVVDVRITDAKMAYGVLRYEVEPVSGSGRKFIDAGRFNSWETVQA